MLQKTDASYFIAYNKNSTPLVLHQGERLSVRLGNTLPDGKTLVTIRGITLSAEMPSSLSNNSTITVQVNIKDNKLILTPIQNESENINLTSSLVSFPDSELASSITQNLSELQQNTPLNLLESIYNATSEFVNQLLAEHPELKKDLKTLKERAGFLETVLQSKNLFLLHGQKKSIFFKVFGLNSEKQDQSQNPPFKNFKKLFSKGILGKNHNLNQNSSLPANETENAQELLMLLNHSPSKYKFNWVLLPFEKESFSGCIAFLISVKEGLYKKCVIRAQIKGSPFVFTLENKICNFFIEGKEITKAEKSKLITMLQQEFDLKNLHFHVAYATEPKLKLQAIDVEA